MTTLKTKVKLPDVNSQGKITANNIDKITNDDGSIKVGSITVTPNEVDDTTGEDGDCYIKYTPKPDTYGVKIEISNSSPDGAVTYIEGAEGMEPGWDNWKDHELFKDIRPCVLKDGVVQYYLQRDDYTKKEDGRASTLNGSDGDVMVEIPKMGYKMTTDGTYHYISVTKTPNKKGYCYLAHSKETEGDCDYIYVGAYLGLKAGTEEGSIIKYKLYSIADTSPTTSETLTKFRTYATNKGDGYELFSFYPLTLLQCLFLLIYKNRNSQSALGRGYTGSSSSINTGTTKSETFCYGSTSDGNNVKFLGIEDFWGNCFCWIDGIFNDVSRKLYTYYKNFTNTDNGTSPDYTLDAGISSNISGHILNIVGTNNGGFILNSGSGSSSTYYCDFGSLFASCCAVFGGNWNNGAYAGVFALNFNYSASFSSSFIAARLLYKHLAS